MPQSNRRAGQWFNGLAHWMLNHCPMANDLHGIQGQISELQQKMADLEKKLNDIKSINIPSTEAFVGQRLSTITRACQILARHASLTQEERAEIAHLIGVG